MALTGERHGAPHSTLVNATGKPRATGNKCAGQGVSVYPYEWLLPVLQVVRLSSAGWREHRRHGPHIAFRYLPGLRGSVALQAWRLSVTAGISTLLVKRYYDLLVDGQPRSDLIPWLVQPTFAIEASWP